MMKCEKHNCYLDSVERCERSDNPKDLAQWAYKLGVQHCEMEAERYRYREALEKIAMTQTRHEYSCYHHNATEVCSAKVVKIAKDALSTPSK